MTKAITVRSAKHADLLVLERLIKDSPYAPYFEGMDMEGAENYWLLAERGDDPLGALLIIFGKPYAFMDFLCLQEGLKDFDRGRTVSRLANEAEKILTAAGASFLVSAISHEQKTFRRVAKRRHYITAASGALVCKRVA